MTLVEYLEPSLMTGMLALSKQFGWNEQVRFDFETGEE